MTFINGSERFSTQLQLVSVFKLNLHFFFGFFKGKFTTFNISLKIETLISIVLTRSYLSPFRMPHHLPSYVTYYNSWQLFCYKDQGAVTSIQCILIFLLGKLFVSHSNMSSIPINVCSTTSSRPFIYFFHLFPLNFPKN